MKKLILKRDVLQKKDADGYSYDIDTYIAKTWLGLDGVRRYEKITEIKGLRSQDPNFKKFIIESDPNTLMNFLKNLPKEYQTASLAKDVLDTRAANSKKRNELEGYHDFDDPVVFCFSYTDDNGLWWEYEAYSWIKNVIKSVLNQGLSLQDDLGNVVTAKDKDPFIKLFNMKVEMEEREFGYHFDCITHKDLYSTIGDIDGIYGRGARGGRGSSLPTDIIEGEYGKEQNVREVFNEHRKSRHILSNHPNLEQ